MIDIYSVIKYPVSTEKAIRLMETENKLTVIVDKKANKPEIKQAAEEMFKIKVIKVNTLISKGKKKAYLKLSKDTPAIDVATQLGLM